LCPEWGVLPFKGKYIPTIHILSLLH
jgi:hypothetical protein